MISALIVSLYNTLNEYIPTSKRLEGEYYYSFDSLFLYGVYYVGFVYLLVGVPLSMFIDNRLKFFKVRVLYKAIIRMLLYLIMGSTSIAVIIGFVSKTQIIDFGKVLIGGLIGSLIFFLVLTMLEGIVLMFRFLKGK